MKGEMSLTGGIFRLIREILSIQDPGGLVECFLRFSGNAGFLLHLATIKTVAK